MSEAILQLAATQADWWNLPMYAIDRLVELQPRTAPARTSLQQMVAYVPDEARRAATEQLAERRFGGMPGRLAVGDASELRDRFGALHAQGVERIYLWFADFAEPATVDDFGAKVIQGAR
jgi:hypothetical protein